MFLFYLFLEHFVAPAISMHEVIRNIFEQKEKAYESLYVTLVLFNLCNHVQMAFWYLLLFLHLLPYFSGSYSPFSAISLFLFLFLSDTCFTCILSLNSYTSFFTPSNVLFSPISSFQLALLE